MMDPRTNYLLHGSNGNSHMPVRAPWDPTLQSDQYRLSFPLRFSKMMLEMAQRSEEGRDDQDEKCGERTLVPSSSSETPLELELSKVGNDESSFVFITNGADILNSSSSLTASEHTEPSTFRSSFLTNEEGAHPRVETDCVPYAQLCFDPERNTLVTLMKVNLASSSGQRSKRLCIVDQYEGGLAKEEGCLDPNTSGTDSTVSDHSEDEIFAPEPMETTELKVRFDESIVYSSTSPENWFEEAELDLYLLHECQDPWEVADKKAHGGCSEAMKKLLLASKSLKVFKSRSGQEYTYSTEEQFTTIGYTFLQEI